MWADHETSTDLLGTKHLKEAVLDILKNTKLLPATVGIFGDWGSGKSSLIKMVSEELKSDKDALVLDFNGWLFEGYDDAKSSLMETIIDELIQKTPKNKLKEVTSLAVRLLRKINWFRLGGKAIQYGVTAAVTGGLGVLTSTVTDIPALAKKAGELLENVDSEKAEEILKKETTTSISRNIRSFRNEFHELIEKSVFSSVIVTIDDLDRCLPNTIIETLEAIRLFLYVPKTAFILGADERLVKYAVRSRFPELPGDRTDVGRDYLEKLVQYTVRILPMTPVDTENYITLLLLDGKIEKERFQRCIDWVLDSKTIQEGRVLSATDASGFLSGLSEELREDLALAKRIGRVLGVGLNGNPRQCKRFLNTLVMRLKMASSRGIDLERRVLSKLMLLEYFRPQLFRSLSGLQSIEGGISKQLKLLEKSLGHGETEETLENSEKDKSPDIELWSQDKWILQWLNSEPPLSGKDLGPYFYFSREKLTDISDSSKRLSPEAQKIIRNLFSQSEAVRNNAFRQAKNISQADAATILDELIEKTRNTENHSDKNSPLRLSIDWIKEWPALVVEFMAFIDTFPDNELPVWVATSLEAALKNTAHNQVLCQFLDRLSNSQTARTAVKKAAKNRLAKIRKGGN
jgi:predicted KAP-like P-loop ATPase